MGFHGLMADGGMAEYTVVPSNQVHKLPDSVSAGDGCAGRADVGGLPRRRPRRGQRPERALIYGAGPIGIGLWFALRGMGLTEIDVVEPRRPAGRRSRHWRAHP